MAFPTVVRILTAVVTLTAFVGAVFISDLPLWQCALVGIVIGAFGAAVSIQLRNSGP